MSLAKRIPLSLAALLPLAAQAYDLTDTLTIEAAVRGIGQHASYDNAVDEDGKDLDNKTRAAGIFDLAVDFHPSANDQLFAWARFAAGNGLNDIGGTALAPYGGDLEDDVKDINGRNRDYLLEAWYKHSVEFSNDSTLGVTGGIIDSTVYVDDNEYANDQDAQFMNEAFVNSANAAFPSYDLGGAVEFDAGRFSARGVYMNTKNDQDRSYNYFAGQVGFHPETELGQGNYRLFAFTTSGDFNNPSGTSDNESIKGFGVSFDQAFGDTYGGFLRAVWVDDNIDTLYEHLLSVGGNIRGSLWGRSQDNAGIGYAYLSGPKASELDETHVGEAYVRFGLNQYLDISFDLQYEKDELRGGGDDPSAWIVGTRINAAF